MSDRPNQIYPCLVSRISPPTDALAEVLKGINVRSTILCRSHFTAPWGFRVDGSDLAKFHIVLDGAAWLDLDSPAETHRLAVGAIVVLPRGTGPPYGTILTARCATSRPSSPITRRTLRDA
jgi:hypothetical protein